MKIQTHSNSQSIAAKNIGVSQETTRMVAVPLKHQWLMHLLQSIVNWYAHNYNVLPILLKSRNDTYNYQWIISKYKKVQGKKENSLAQDRARKCYPL